MLKKKKLKSSNVTQASGAGSDGHFTPLAPFTYLIRENNNYQIYVLDKQQEESWRGLTPLMSEDTLVRHLAQNML